MNVTPGDEAASLAVASLQFTLAESKSAGWNLEKVTEVWDLPATQLWVRPARYAIEP